MLYGDCVCLPDECPHPFTGDVSASSSYNSNEFIGRTRRPYGEEKQS